MDHAQATELFSSYWDEELHVKEAEELEDHLRSCVVCRREYQRFEQTVSSVGQLAKADAPPDFVAKVLKRAHARSGGRLFSPRRLAERIPYELFSLVMLGIILAIYLFLQMSQPARLNLP